MSKQANSTIELRLIDLEEKGLRLRLQKATQQLVKLSELRENRRSIARLLTLNSLKD